MRRNLLFCIPVLFAVLGCAGEKNKELVPELHDQWLRTTETELDYPIPGHESHYRRIFINDIGRDYTITVRDGRIIHEYPKGTIIIKDIYPGLSFDPEEDPVMQTVMLKDPEHPKNRSGWVWIVKDLKTGNERIMDDPFCITCHAGANESHPYGDKNIYGEHRDFVFFPPEQK